MEINVHEEQRYVSVWLTRAEAADSEVKDHLKPFFAKCRAKKYRVVVFESGHGDLMSLTKDLLAHNLEVSARKEA